MAEKNVPEATDISRDFWAGTVRGEFMLQHDAKAGRSQFFPRPVSQFGNGKLEWKAASGLGTLMALTSAAPPAGSDGPGRVGIVKLDEGPRVFARVLKAGPDLAPGARMRLTWSEARDGVRLYAFEPA